MSMHQRAEHYRGQFEPWDPSYVIPFACPVPLMIDKLGVVAFQKKDDMRIRAALYVNAVIMGLGQG